MLTQGTDDLRIDRIEIDFGVVPVAGEGQHGRADAAAEQFQRIGGHQVDALRIGLERVGEEFDGPHAAGVNTLGRQGGDVVSGDALRIGQPDPVSDFYIVIVQGDGQGINGEYRANGKGEGGLRRERLGPLVLGNRVATRQGWLFNEVAVSIQAEGGVPVVGLSHGRCSKARAKGAAYGQIFFEQVPATGQFAVQGFADAFMVLETARSAEQYLLDDVGLQVDIRPETAPVGLHPMLGPDTGIRVRADVEALLGESPTVWVLTPAPALSFVIDAPGVLFAGFDLVVLLAVFEAEGDVQRGIEQTDIERTGEVQVKNLVLLLVGTREKFGRNPPSETGELWVDAVPDHIGRPVLAKHGAHIVVPAIKQRRGAV